MKRRAIVLSFFVVLGLLFLEDTHADTATSTSFKIDTGVIDTGGSRATSSGFNLNTSIGEPATGISTSSNFILRGGFLQFPAPATAAATTTDTGAGGAGGNSGFISGPGALTPAEIIRRCDFNNDGKCNIIDLSILLFYYNRSGSLIARYDLNGNNRVDFTDISVLMFYWTA